jgi:hypothetical protein
LAPSLLEINPKINAICAGVRSEKEADEILVTQSRNERDK